MKAPFTTAVVSAAGGRAYNQDCARHAERADLHCWALADGLGGHGGGELAADLAVTSLLAQFESHAECSPAALRTYVAAASAAVVKGQQENPSQAAMRTTLVVLLADPAGALWAHVGDSRLYYLRAGRIARQTRDHSVPQAMVEAGKISAGEVRFHEDRNRLLRSVGGPGDAGGTFEDQCQELAPGDAFLMATDGFWEYVKELEMEVELAKAVTPDQWLEGMAARLRARAPEDNDNYSAIAVFVNQAGALDAGPNGRRG
jgi:serine/threonine protein phosphatase PrpC